MDENLFIVHVHLQQALEGIPQWLQVSLGLTDENVADGDLIGISSSLKFTFNTNPWEDTRMVPISPYHHIQQNFKAQIAAGMVSGCEELKMIVYLFIYFSNSLTQFRRCI